MANGSAKYAKRFLFVSSLVSLCCLGSLSNGVFGYTALPASQKHIPDFDSFAEEQAAAEKVDQEIVEEGAVLLKNKGSSLPLKKSEMNVTTFGAASVSPCYGGGGSGSASASSYQEQITPEAGLKNAGFNVNPRLINFYTNEYLPSHPIKSTTNSEIHYAYSEPAAKDFASVEQSYSLYNDAAIVFVYGVGSEGTDRLRGEYNDGTTYSSTDDAKEGHTSPGVGHSLELTSSEIDLINYVTGKFDKVIVVLNTSNAIECGWLQDNDKIDGVVWIGNPGISGFNALGTILSGTVNPSGHLADVYPADLTKDPTWNNFGDNSQSGTNAVCIAYDSNGNRVSGLAAGRANTDQGVPSVEYEENVYYGYKWYETAAKQAGYFNTTNLPAGETDAYYNRTNGVVYPFGFGLSYTSFDWKLTGTATTGTVVAGDEIKIQAEVTNNGSVAGKDVVQVYYSAPYINGEIEKSDVNLVTFAKTKVLEPGEKQIVNLSFDVKEMASFDWDDANKNSFKGYELDAGDYTITLRSDSHTVKNTITRTVENTIKYDGSTTTLNYNGDGLANATTLFSNDDIYYTAAPKSANSNKIVNEVTRANSGLIQPVAPTIQTNMYADETLNQVKKFNVFTPDMDAGKTYADDKDYAWLEESSVGTNWTQGTGVKDSDGKYAIQASDMIGKDLSDSSWETFMNQLTYDEMAGLMGCQPNAISSIGLSRLSAADGPAQLKGGASVGTFWCCETLIGTTWNVDLASRQGQLVGNEGLLKGVLGWWGPAMNIHRSAFGGRNFEYYSQDGVHSGYMAAAVCGGATSKGLVTYAKHFAVNDQETFREANDGVIVWCNEQAMREIYLKPFEYAVKRGNCNGLMTSYNRLGAVSADVNYRLMNSLCRKEWGFKGNYVSDANAVNARSIQNADGTYGSQKFSDLVIRAGCVDLSGSNGRLNSVTWDATKRDGKGDTIYTNNGAVTEIPNEYYAIRNIAQRFLYIEVNSFGMNNCLNTSAFEGKDITGYKGQAVNQSIAVDAASTGADCISYSLASGTLPDGLSISSAGLISGTPTETGKFTFTVTATMDYYVTTTKQFTVEIISPFTVENDSFDNLKAGTEVDSKIDFALASSYNSTKFSVDSGSLPDGMSLAEDGVIYGTPTKAGEYTFTVKVVGTSGQGWWQRMVSFTQTYTVTVKEADQIQKTYTVSFDTNGGSTIASQTINEGATVTIPSIPTKEGYTFNSWYLDANCSAVADLSNKTDANITYYAGWTKAGVAENVMNAISSAIEENNKNISSEIAAINNNVTSGNATVTEEAAAAQNAANRANGTAIAGITVGIVGIVVGACGVLIGLLAKKKPM
jgi:beta-glucosidase